MRILLTTLNSKYVHSNLALKYLYTSASEEVDGMELREFTINNNQDQILTELIDGAYDVVCFSCYIWNIREISELCSDLKKAQPDVRIVLGGPEVSHEPEKFMAEHGAVDFIVYGEGEYTFKLLCRALSERFTGTAGTSRIEITEIKGLAYRRAGNIFLNPPMPLLKFETIPFPYSKFPCEEDRVIYYESCRGCLFNCSYCLSSVDKSVRALPLERTKQDISYFLYRNVKQVKFIDRTFNWDEERAYEILKHISDMDNGKSNFHFELCGDLVSERIFELIAKARKGLFQFEIGIQSTCEKTLRAVDRRPNTDILLKNISRLAECGTCHVHIDLIAGLPFESYSRFKKSFNDVYTLGADALQLGFLKLLKGTAIRSEADMYGYKYKTEPPYQVISNDFISAAEIVRLKKIEKVLDLYYNRGGYSRSLAYMTENLYETPFDFYEAFGEFYYGNGYQHASHKKEDLYRILHKFAGMTGCDDETMELITGLLAEDLEKTMNFDAVKKFKRKGWIIP